MSAPLLVISCSLSPASRSRALARYAHERLTAIGAPPTLVDLAGLDLPVCDGDAACDHPRAAELRGKILAASGVLLAFPIYNYDAGAAAKNLIELTGSAWEGKVVAMACAAGAMSSYMAPMGLAQSLMLDFHCFVLPRFVLATAEAFAGGDLADDRVRQRMDRLAAELVRVAIALRGAGSS